MNREMVPLFEGDDDFEYGDDREFLEELEQEAEQDAVNTVAEFRKRQGARYMCAQNRIGYKRMLEWVKSKYGQSKTTVSLCIREAKGEAVYAQIAAKQMKRDMVEVPILEPHQLPDALMEALLEQRRQDGMREQLEKDKAVIERAKARIADLEGREAELNGVVQDKDDIIADLQQKQATRPLSQAEQMRLDAAEKANAKYRAEIERIGMKLISERNKSKQSPMPRLRDLQGETQQRILNDWATTTHIYVMGSDTFLAHIPDVVSRQQFDADAWQRLGECKVALKEVQRAIEGIEHERDYEGGVSAVSNGRIVDAG